MAAWHQSASASSVAKKRAKIINSKKSESGSNKQAYGASWQRISKKNNQQYHQSSVMTGGGNGGMAMKASAKA